MEVDPNVRVKKFISAVILNFFAPTFEFFDIESDGGHDLAGLGLFRFEVVEDRGLAGVVQANHEDVALLFPYAQDVGQFVEQPHFPGIFEKFGRT